MSFRGCASVDAVRFFRLRLRIILRGRAYFNFEKHDAFAETKRSPPGRGHPGICRAGDLASVRASAARHIAECRRDGSKKLLPEYPPGQPPRRSLRVRLPI